MDFCPYFLDKEISRIRQIETDVDQQEEDTNDESVTNSQQTDQPRRPNTPTYPDNTVSSARPKRTTRSPDRLTY